MLGFAPLSSVPLSSLPGAGQVASGFVSGSFGTPIAAYARTQAATGADPSTTFGTAKFGTTVAATSVAPSTKLGAPPKFGPIVTTLYGNGADGSTTFLDDSPYYWSVTRNGSIAVSTAQSRFGTGSISLTGASTANNLVVGPSKLFNLTGWGSSFPQFTIEAEVFLNAYNSNGGRLLSAGGGASGWGTYGSSVNGHHWMLQSTATGVQFTWMWYGAYSGFTNFHMFSLSAPLSLSTWAQIKVTSDGTTVRLFVDGALIGSDSGHPPVSGMSNLTFNYPAYVAVGALYGEASGSTNAANAYVQHIRIRRECTDTAAFSAPTAGLGRWIGELAGIAPTTQVPTSKIGIVQPATGFTTTQFGTGFGQNLQRPTGFQSTIVGDPRIFPYSPPPINSTQFGTGRLFPYHVAPGINGTQFGAPAGRQHWNAQPLGAPGPTSRVSMAYFRFDQTRVATGASTTHIGTAQGHHVLTTPVGRTCQAFGICATAFGSARYVYAQSASATSMSATAFGTPRVGFAQLATGWVGTSVPAPAATVATYAHGSRMPAYGAAILRITLPATGFLYAQRFGLASSERSNTYETYGINCAGRFGQPVGGSWHNHPATGFALAVLGAPALKQGHRATGLPPNGHLGDPLLKRITQC